MESDATLMTNDEDFWNLLPPGYKFRPTDEELVIFYLAKKILKLPLPPSKIKAVNIYNYSPQHLYDLYKEPGEEAMYFFTSRVRKYPKGKRPNRVIANGNGYWKASGADKLVGPENNPIGQNKSLVYYQGKHKNATKTDWLMHEFTINFQRISPTRSTSDDMKLDDCVLCKIYKKAKKSKEEEGEDTDIPSISSEALNMFDEMFKPEEPNRNAPELPNMPHSDAMHCPSSQMLGDGDNGQTAVSMPQLNPNFLLLNGEHDGHPDSISNEVQPYKYDNCPPETNQVSAYPFSPAEEMNMVHDKNAQLISGYGGHNCFSTPNWPNPDAMSRKFVPAYNSGQNSFPMPAPMPHPGAAISSSTSSQHNSGQNSFPMPAPMPHSGTMSRSTSSQFVPGQNDVPIPTTVPPPEAMHFTSSEFMPDLIGQDFSIAQSNQDLRLPSTAGFDNSNNHNFDCNTLSEYGNHQWEPNYQGLIHNDVCPAAREMNEAYGIPQEPGQRISSEFMPDFNIQNFSMQQSNQDLTLPNTVRFDGSGNHNSDYNTFSEYHYHQWEPNQGLLHPICTAAEEMNKIYGVPQVPGQRISSEFPEDQPTQGFGEPFSPTEANE